MTGYAGAFCHELSIRNRYLGPEPHARAASPERVLTTVFTSRSRRARRFVESSVRDGGRPLLAVRTPNRAIGVVRMGTAGLWALRSAPDYDISALIGPTRHRWVALPRGRQGWRDPTRSPFRLGGSRIRILRGRGRSQIRHRTPHRRVGESALHVPEVVGSRPRILPVGRLQSGIVVCRTGRVPTTVGALSTCEGVAPSLAFAVPILAVRGEPREWFVLDIELLRAAIDGIDTYPGTVWPRPATPARQRARLRTPHLPVAAVR